MGRPLSINFSPLSEIRHDAAAQVGLCCLALDQPARFEVAQYPRQARAQQKRNPGEFGDLDGVDRGLVRAGCAIGCSVRSWRRSEGRNCRINGFAGAKQRHRQRAGEFAHRNAVRRRRLRKRGPSPFNNVLDNFLDNFLRAIRRSIVSVSP